ncbi:MAG: hypothetical protein LBG24_10920 [Treponema sp.]|jgi:hypothetical protein|nr:hypothetical protein [Treponema sp.]
MNRGIGKRIRAIGSGCIGGLLFLAGCFNGLEAPETPEARAGMVSITIGEAARTVGPDLGQFDELELVITPEGGGKEDKKSISGGQATVYLDEGVWDLRVDGYVQKDLLATATNTLTNTKGVISGNTRFSLAPVGTKKGTLKYTITKPEGSALEAGSSLKLSRADGSPVLDLEGFSEGVLSLSDSASGSVKLDPGRYQVEIVLLGPKEASAAVKETAVILPELVTELRFEPGSFADPTLLAPLSFGTTQDNTSRTRIGAAGVTATGGRTQAIFAAGIQDTVYFTLAKTAAQTVSVESNLEWVTKATGAVDDTTPGAGLEVFTVDTSSIRNGGYKDFTLKVTETGKTDITIAVTVSVGKFGLFIEVAAEGDGEPTLTPVESDEPIENLKDALAYLSAFATANTTYVIHLDKDEAIPLWAGFSSSQKNNTLRLRGIGGARTVSWDQEPITYITNAYGLLTLNNTTTLELDHIILDGKKVPITGKNYSLVYLHETNSTLVLKEGTKLTNFVSSGAYYSTTPYGSLIASLSNRAGTVIMKGGEISGNECAWFLIAVNNFEMYGGSIRNNNSRGTHGYPHFAQVPAATDGNTRPSAVITVSSFIMEDGEIRDNGQSSIMGGVVINGTGTMSGGFIEGNGKYGAIAGGGVLIGHLGTFTMKGGTIRNNSSTESLGNEIFAAAIANGANRAGELILEDEVTLDGRIGLAVGTFSSGNTMRYGTVNINPNFTNKTARPITLDIYLNSTSDSNTLNINFITTEAGIDVKDILKHLTLGDYGKGTVSSTFSSGPDYALPNLGRVEEVFMVEEDTWVLQSYITPEA